MTQGTRLGLLCLILVGLSTPWATSVTAQEDASQATVAQATPSYRPPLRGAPASRIGGAHRGAEGDDWTLLVLAPEHTGLTTSEQPVLYWYTSKDIDQPVEFTLIERGAIDPLFERRIPGPLGAGVQRVALADLGLSLRPETEYQWFVSVVTDPTQRSQDYAAGATIRRVAVDPQVRTRLQSTTAEQRAFVYAEAGLWYDAIDALSQQVDEAPSNETARGQRRALVEQVGLQMPPD
jgi:hypothetical protein